jgi:hypothetical protein
MKKIFLISFLTSLALTSCESYLDVNEDQSNKAPFDAIAPNQMLAGAINNYVNHQVVTLSSYGNKMSYVWGLNSGFTTTDAAYTYIYTSSNYQTAFENTYLFGDNFQDIIDKKATFPEYSLHFGISKLFKVISMDYLTALYGDVPYTEAFNSNIVSPKYDDDKAIIPALFLELDEARAYLASTTAKPLGAEDIVFGGNLTKWKKLINTVELRMLMRLSKTTDPTLVALRTARFAALTQDFINQDVTVNPGYNLSALLKRSPLYRAYARNEALNGFTSAYSSNAAGDYVAKLVNGTFTDSNITADIVDPRRSNMFTLVGGVVKGNIQGVFPTTAISRFSTFYHGRNVVGAVGDKNGSERNAFLMLAAESYFLQAEAFERTYLVGNAHTAFDNGITASFNFYSTPFGTATYPILNAGTYISTTDSKNGLGWSGSTDKINAIMTQKYLALAQWQGIETYIDHMRTGFPVLPIPVGAAKPNRPNRLIYPNSEYSSNSKNVPNVTNDDLFTINSKTPYYLQP